MKNLVLNTSASVSATTIRIILGIVIFSHGAQAMLGWFGGSGLSATLQALTTFMGLPWLVALSVICLQFFGSLMLLLGIGTRVAALGILGMFIGMIPYHVDFGFFMNWTGSQQGEGFEYHILVIGMCLVLLIDGGGTFSLDRNFSKISRP